VGGHNIRFAGGFALSIKSGGRSEDRSTGERDDRAAARSTADAVPFDVPFTPWFKSEPTTTTKSSRATWVLILGVTHLPNILFYLPLCLHPHVPVLEVFSPLTDPLYRSSSSPLVIYIRTALVMNPSSRSCYLATHISVKKPFY